MKRLAALSVLALTASPSAAQILRHAAPPGPKPAIILQGVTVPAGAETLYLSGQVADPIAAASTQQSTAPAFGDTKTQAISVFNKIQRLLAARGYALSDVIKLTVYAVGDPKLGGRMDFAGFNDAYRLFFGTGDNPNLVARSTVQVAALAAPEYLIEIEATAAKTK
ncbi:RidA family protein [Sphingomonas jatrophae]|uniref:Enamine deaminase RidA, house cleaning of reactive enamine intermediates, YjgF/YER057c/UK114 family n=1 Tax=Sphingomonas jatrophae TaxID=1166337 RepID=A0A1I6JCL7_9SPHN|nr:RidA family protein [Sphingomonas jatrophae]SFR76709.1 Enamine deaminase RidA, house cleaning of reactive enamine intermediates, YjgF/YER057c/UK114 family [Sphingomonas jatrophae]